MAGTTIQSKISVDITAGAKLTGDAKAEFDQLRRSLLDSGNTAKDTEAVLLKMKDVLDADAASMKGVSDAANTMKSGLEGIGQSAKLASESTGGLKEGLNSVNKSVTGGGGFLDTMQKQKIAFQDVGRLITGQGFSLRSLSANFALLGPAVVIGAAALGFLAEELYKVYKVESDAVKAQKLYNETLTDAGKTAATAIEEVTKIRETFKLAEDGVISKTQAVEEYNKSIGKTTGQVKTLQQAEEALQKNAQSFIDMTLQKAIAETAGQKAAQAEIDLLLLQNKHVQQWAKASKDAAQTTELSRRQLSAAITETQERELLEANKNVQLYTKIAQDGYTKMEQIAKQFHFNPIGINLQDQKKSESAIEKYKKSLEQLQIYIQKLNLSPTTDLHKSLDELQINYNKVVEVAKAAKVPYTQATADMEAERLRLIKDFNSLVLGELHKSGLEAFNTKVKSEDQIDKFVEEILKKRIKGSKSQYEAEKKQIEDNASVEINAIKDSDSKSALEKAQNAAKRLKILEKEYADEKAAAIANGQSVSKIDNEITKNKQDQQKAQDDINEAKLQSDIAYAQQAGQLLNSLSQIIGNSTQAGKDVAIAGVSIESLATAAKAQLLADGYFAAGDIPSGIIAEASAVEAIVQGIASIQKINSVTVPHASAASNSNSSIGGGSSYSAPQIATAVQTTNLSGQSIQQIQQINQQQGAIRAFVVETDITQAQNRVAGFRSAATLGPNRH